MPLRLLTAYIKLLNYFVPHIFLFLCAVNYYYCIIYEHWTMHWTSQWLCSSTLISAEAPEGAQKRVGRVERRRRERRVAEGSEGGGGYPLPTENF